MLRGKRVLVGVSGGIAAYKTPFLIRGLVKQGCCVKVVATKNALEFVTLATLRTISQNPVYYDVFSQENTFSTQHVSLASWADVFIVAPASANIIGKMACGIADDALSTELIAFEKDVFLAPAMNTAMYNNPAVKDNLATLKKRGVNIIEPVEGELACGSSGKGRMEEPQNIICYLEEFYSDCAELKPLKGKRVLITAAGTQ